LGGENGSGACFHDDNEARSTGLIEWLYAQKADTVIIGGLATEEAISRTAEQLLWYNDSLHIIVNLAACHGYAPESTIQAVYKMRKSGISVVSNAEEIPGQMLRYANEAWFKVS